MPFMSVVEVSCKSQTQTCLIFLGVPKKSEASIQPPNSRALGTRTATEKSIDILLMVEILHGSRCLNPKKYGSTTSSRSGRMFTINSGHWTPGMVCFQLRLEAAAGRVAGVRV